MKSIFGICNIHGVNIATFDLNLLKALDALLETASVSRASERLNLSQPAVSAALARLRRHLDDPLGTDKLTAAGRTKAAGEGG